MSLLGLVAVLGPGCDAGSGAGAAPGTGTPPPAKPQDLGDMLVEYDDAVSNEALVPWIGALQESALFPDLAGIFNDALAFPRDLTVGIGQCDMVNAFYVPGEDVIVMCLEVLADASELFLSPAYGADAETAAEAALSTFIFVFFHELGHALVDYLDIPITGREEDAVDDFAAVLSVEAGLGDVALYAASWFALSSSEGRSPEAFADEHSLDMQRFYNILCVVYGSDPAAYAGLETSFPEMADRLPRCQGEYEQKSASWDALLTPHAK